jgi:hypothetical protein
VCQRESSGCSTQIDEVAVVLLLLFSVAWLISCPEKVDEIDTSPVGSHGINIYSFMDLKSPKIAQF